MFLSASDKNLLKNQELNNDSAKSSQITDWVIKSDSKVQRDVIVAFQGLADSMFYLKGKGRAQIRQKNIKIKTNTWYVISLWYKNFSKGKARTPYNLYLAAAKTGGGNWDAFYYKCFGGSAKWIKARAFFYSGNKISVDFLAMFFGNDKWEIGRLTLRKVKQSDFYSNFVADSDFEKGVLNGQPADFRKTGKLSNAPFLKENDGFPAGAQNMAAELSPEHPLKLVGPAFMVQKNDLVKISIWTKADKPGVKLSLIVRGNKFSKSSGVALSTAWRKFELLMKMPSSGRYFIKGPRHLKTYIDVTGSSKSLVSFDRFELKIAPPKKKTKKKNGINLLLMNSSFESGLAGWEWMFYESVKSHKEGGKVSIDMETASEGSCSLKIKVPKSSSGYSSHRLLLKSACFDAVSLVPYTVSFWAKADIENAKVSVGMFYGTGGHCRLSKEWERYQFKVVPQRDKQGKNTLNLYFPLNGGTYWIDGVQVEKGDKMTTYESNGKLEVGGIFPNKIYPFFTFGEKAEADVYLCSRFDKEKEFNFSWEAVDYRQKTVASYSRKIKIPAKKTIKINMPLFSKLKGHFIVNFKLQDPVSKLSTKSPLVYGVFPKARKVNAKDSWFGILPGSLGSGRKGSPFTFMSLKGGTYDKQMKILRLCGFNWIRTFAPGDWARTERKKGEFDWAFDKAMQTIFDNGFKIYTVLGAFNDYPKWSDSGTTFEHKIKGEERNYPNISDWKNYAEAFVKHYKDKVDTITILSETGGYNVKEYFKLIEALYPAIKKTVPEMNVAVPGYPCGGLPMDDKDNTWIGRLMKKGAYKYMDIYHGHFYISGHAHGLAKIRKEPFESAINGKYGTKIDELSQQMTYFRKTYGNKPIWDTESGTIFTASVPWMEIPPEHLKYDWYTPEVSAARMVRWGVVKMAYGIKKQMYFMFNLPFMHNYHCLDIVNYNMSPRVGLPALSQFAKRLDTAKFKKSLKVGLNTSVYIFELDGKTVAVYWNHLLENKKRAKIVLPFTTKILVEDIMGNSLKTETRAKHITLPLACSPIYLVSDKLSVDAMVKVFKKAKTLGATDCKLRVTPGNINGKAAIIAEILNLSSEPLKDVKLNIKLPPGWESEESVISLNSIAPLKSARKSIILKSLNNAPNETIKISTMINGTVYGNQSRNLFLAKISKVNDSITVDGKIDVNEYGKEAILTLDKASQVLDKIRSNGGRPKQKSWLKKDKPVSGKIWSKWSSDVLYMGFEIKDNYVFNNAPQGTLFAGDCVELYLDFFPSKNIFSKNYEDHQIKLVFAPANGKYPIRFQAEAMGLTVNTFKYIDFNKIKMTSIKTNTGYNIEVRIPLRNTALNSGKIIGLNVQLIGYGKDKKKDSYALMWNGKVSWNNPRNFGFAVLE